MSGDNKKPGPTGAAGGAAFSPQDAMEFMQKMWNPLGVTMPAFGLPAAAAVPGAMPFPNPAAIAELKIIENWLTMSVSMMQMSIKTMELQKASLEAMRGSMGASKK